MNKFGFVDPGLVPLCGRLAGAFDVFESELRGLEQGDFVRWFDVDVYDGEWFVYPIVAQLDPLPPGFDLAHARRRCPRSSALLAAEPQILLAGFSRLMPGTRVRAHTDRPGSNVLRFHLGLSTNDECALGFDRETRSSERGRFVLFDHSMVHSSHNLGAVPRDLLLVDILLGEEEVAAVRAVRGAVHLGPTAEASGIGP